MAASTKDLVNQFIKLDGKIKKKDGEVKKMKEELALLEQQLIPRFEEGGIASMKSTTKVTVYIRRDLWAGATNKDNEAMCAAIKGIPEIAELVKEKVNTQTLSAYVREKGREFYGDTFDSRKPDELVKALPESLQSVITITEDISLRARKG